MIRKILSATAVGVLCCTSVWSQAPLDNYFTGTNSFKVIGNASNGLVNPQDLDFVPGRPNEWWVLNYEANSGSVVIFYDADKASQNSELRRDSHSGHFMIRPSSISIGANGNFATSQEVQNTNPSSPTFMGPALWTTDTSIFARMHQSNWDPSKPLGSHIDMLHQSPYSMGVEYDNGNAYWVFDGYNGSICLYDFKKPHVVGGDDHKDGEILRYSSLNVQRKSGIPSHLALDRQNKWLYIVDGGTGRILRLKTDDGAQGNNLNPDPGAVEPLTVYREVTGFTSEVVVASGLTSPCGIDYRDGRIVVSDNATGDIYIYNVTSMPATLVGKISTGSVGVMGVRIDNDNRIWYVNRNKRELVKINNPNVPVSVSSVTDNDLAFKVYPNPANSIVYVELDNKYSQEESSVKLYDLNGRVVRNVNSRNSKVVSLNIEGLAAGMYTVEVSNSNKREVRKLMIQ